MSDANPTTVFHRALRELADVGCVLDPWASRRAYQCQEAPLFDLEPLDCLVNKFKEMPTRLRGVVERVPFRDLSAVRADPLTAAGDSCGMGASADLVSAFERAGLACSVACGAVPYGDPPCPALDDDMGMVMLACYEDGEINDPGFMTARASVPFGATVGVYPEPVAPVCPSVSNPGTSACVEKCVEVIGASSYADNCWRTRLDTVCVCGAAIYVTTSREETVGCNCCGQLPPAPGSSSSSSSSGEPGSSSASSSSGGAGSSSSSSSSAPADPCPTDCGVGSVNWGMSGTSRGTNTSLAYAQADADCGSYPKPNACSSFAPCGKNQDGCVSGFAYDGGDGFWYVDWWKCCYLA